MNTSHCHAIAATFLSSKNRSLVVGARASILLVAVASCSPSGGDVSPSSEGSSNQGDQMFGDPAAGGWTVAGGTGGDGSDPGTGESSAGGSAPSSTGGAGNAGTGGGTTGGSAETFHDPNGTIIYADDATQPQIDAASPGDVLLFEPGEHDRFSLDGWNSSECDPLVLVSQDPSNPAKIRNPDRSITIKIDNSSHIVVENLEVEGGLYGIQIATSDHIIVLNNDFHDSEQEGCKVKSRSTYVDILGNKIHHTGRVQNQWGEGIYLGTSGEDDYTGHVWIEGNEIYETANGEALDMKQAVSHVTFRENHVHAIAPGVAGGQTNEGAVQLSGGTDAESADVWVEYNLIEDISWGLGGEAGRHNVGASAIVAFGNGGYIHHNTVRNYQEYGIYFNGAIDNGHTVHEWDNTVEDMGYGAFSGEAVDNVVRADPGYTNPNSPQSWCP